MLVRVLPGSSRKQNIFTRQLPTLSLFNAHLSPRIYCVLCFPGCSKNVDLFVSMVSTPYLHLTSIVSQFFTATLRCSLNHLLAFSTNTLECTHICTLVYNKSHGQNCATRESVLLKKKLLTHRKYRKHRNMLKNKSNTFGNTSVPTQNLTSKMGVAVKCRSWSW